MAISRRGQNLSYGIGQPLQKLPPQPVVSSRAPTTSDFAEIGTDWVRKSTKQSWKLTDITSNSATWTPTSVVAGATITSGGLVITAGGLTVSAGGIDATTGNIYATAGNLIGKALVSTADVGSGIASRLTLTNGDVGSGSLSTGAGTVLLTTANPGNSAGFIKVYVGTSTAYIPYWTDIAP